MSLLSSIVLAAAAIAQPTPLPAAETLDTSIKSPFNQRGYYITFMRMPTFDLQDWKSIVDCIRRDDGNTLLLWTAGGFKSKKFPITWKYNADHENIRADFVRELIEYAHSRGIKVLLGFTPFGYDGVNQYPDEHPELRATGKDGKPVDKFGFHSWGYNLCPSQPKSQQFMLDYIREMCFDFYPNADGLLVESSDYAICHCTDCRSRFFEREFEFVRRISDEVWAKNSDAQIYVYPHYFSGESVPGFETRGARLKFDPRWSLFFTPHSAPPVPELIRQAKSSIWSDDAPALHGPDNIRGGAQRAKAAGITGYVPSLEAFSYVPTEVEQGQPWLKGRRQIPLGFGWVKQGESPYDELPMRVNRIAYREFTRDPDLSMDAFRKQLGEQLFGSSSTDEQMNDVLAVRTIVFADRTWTTPAPLTLPERVVQLKKSGQLSDVKRRELAAQLEVIERLDRNYEQSSDKTGPEIHAIASWIADQWTPNLRELLQKDATK